MNKFSIHFCAVFALCLFSADVFAAPSVKRLGGANTYSGTANAVSAKTGTVPNAGARTASAKTVGRMVAAKPVAANKAVAGDTNANATNTARLSVGKYLHAAAVNSGAIKPTSAVTPTISAFDELSARVSELENQLANKADSADLNNYYSKTDIENNYSTTEQIANDYSTKAELTTVQNTVSELNTTVNNIESGTKIFDSEANESVTVSLVRSGHWNKNVLEKE